MSELKLIFTYGIGWYILSLPSNLKDFTLPLAGRETDADPFKDRVRELARVHAVIGSYSMDR